MISLLDVNVLVAIFDAAHVNHERVHAWFGRARRRGWATTPITENGFIRVVSNPRYAGGVISVDDAVQRLQELADSGHHHFWPDTVTVRESQLWALRHVRGHNQLTDVYLLALAVRNGGRLATLDRNIPLHAVVGADSSNIALVGE